MADRSIDRSSGVQVEGLRELQAELGAAGPEMKKRLGQVNKRLVTSVAEDAAEAMYPPRTGRHGRFGHEAVKRTIKGQASGKEARVVAGGSRAPTFWGFEFGGRARPTTQQFEPHKGTEGYFFYPTVRKRVKVASEEWETLFDEVFGT